MSLAVPAHMRADTMYTPPVEFADAVEEYARRSGRHGSLRFVPFPVNCWIVELTLRADDPRMLDFKAGLIPDEPKEVVYLWRPTTAKDRAKLGNHVQYIGYRLGELGVQGMVELLERGNTQTGRGEHGTVKEAFQKQADAKDEGLQKSARSYKDRALERANDLRRQFKKIPYLGVGIDLQRGPTTAPEE